VIETAAMRTTALVVATALALAAAGPAHAHGYTRSLGDARKAAWLSVAHPGLGEYYNAGWGDFFERCPQKKFWLGLIPLYGWPGYLQILSAMDAYHGCTSDNLSEGCQ
jgi:hypothetical protein